MIDPKAVGRGVARAQDRLTDAARIERRAELLLFDGPNSLFDRQPMLRAGRRRIAAAVVAALALLMTGIIAYPLLSPRNLTVSINGKPVNPHDRQWLVVEAAAETHLDFSDGSHVRLGRDARTRFIEVTSEGAGMLVEQGRLTADIAHLDGADWKFFAGPFEVRVTGTRFTLDWDSKREQLTVDMAQGSVEIRGPSPSKVRSVVAGERFTARVKQHQIEIVATNSAHRHGSADENAAAVRLREPILSVDENTAGSLADKEDEPAVSKKSAPRPSPASASTGELQPSNSCGALGPGARLAEADAARLSGDLEKAENRYRTLRRCAPGSRAAILSAFYLGKIAFDGRHDWEGAARWFERYLREQKGEGPTREAMGRLLEAYVAARRLNRARATARRYLAEYPQGPHAAYATSLLEENTH